MGVSPSQPITGHTPTPWRDPGEHAMTGYGDINHVIIGDDGKVVGALYANCFDAPNMRELPTVSQAGGNAALLIEAVNNYAGLLERLEASTRLINEGSDTLVKLMNAEARIQALEVALDKAERIAGAWTKPSFALLHGGEMSAQELRTVIAVATNIEQSIAALKGEA